MTTVDDITSADQAQAEKVLARLAGIPMCPLCDEPMEDVVPDFGPPTWWCMGRKADMSAMPEWAQHDGDEPGHRPVQWCRWQRNRFANPLSWRINTEEGWQHTVYQPSSKGNDGQFIKLGDLWPAPDRMPRGPA